MWGCPCCQIHALPPSLLPQGTSIKKAKDRIRLISINWDILSIWFFISSSPVDDLWWALGYDTKSLTLCAYSFGSIHIFLLQTFLSLIFQSCTFQATDYKLINLILPMCLYTHLLQGIFLFTKSGWGATFQMQYTLLANGSCMVICPQ